MTWISFWQVFFWVVPSVCFLGMLAAALMFRCALSYWRERAEKAEMTLEACLNAAHGRGSNFLVSKAVAKKDEDHSAWIAVCELWRENAKLKASICGPAKKAS